MGATPNVIFDKNLETNVLTQTTSVDGLKSNNITAILITSNGYKLIGNQNGIINIVKPNGNIINKVDIFLDVPVSQSQKKINDFYEFKGKVYIATDYGISVLSITNFEIIANYYIGSNGEYIKVNQVAIYNDEIYAATEQGIKKATLNNAFLFDFNQWSVAYTGNWLSIITFNNKLIGINNDENTYSLEATPQLIVNHGPNGKKLRTDGIYLTLTVFNKIMVFNSSLALINIVYNIPNSSTFLLCGITKNEKLYIGTSTDGLVETSITNSTNFTNLSPQGPIEDNAFRIKKTSTDLWVTHGDFDINYAPNYKYQGISYLENTTWKKIPKESLQNAVSLNLIIENPRNKKEIFVCSNQSGLLKITDKSQVELFNQTNTGPDGLESQQFVDPNFISVRPHSVNFDKQGNLWMTNSYVRKPIKVLKNDNTWTSYSMENILNPIVDERYGIMEIDKNGTKWIPTFNNGILAFNEKFNNKTILIKVDNGLPTNVTFTLALDKKNQLWIGTLQGLRVLNNVDNFLNSNSLTVKNIVISDNGVGQELFNQQQIIDIVVDGANNKWLSIGNAGVFLVNSNGQETLQRFTTENSPLPSNTINDIEIDENTGEVFFATEKGLVSFKGNATLGKDDLSNVYAYPNPVRPTFSGTVKVSGLMDKCNVKITDVEGNLVHESTSEGGTIEWDTTAFGKYKVASGVYMVFVVSEEGEETAVEKIMIVR